MNYLDKLASLTPFAQQLALQKATEPPYTSNCQLPKHEGSYLCRRCGLALWTSQEQFESHCGWPSFDGRLMNSIIELADADGIRTEILCSRCHAHLGHVFRGEGFTEKNQRDCVNSLMLDFVPHLGILDTEEIIVAGGCFWGLEYFLQKQAGVLGTECGYIGGALNDPSYERVCEGNTGYYEAVRVIYDPKKCSLEELYRLFFEIHDPCQLNGQGPDIGHQYRSAIFYYNLAQKQCAEYLLGLLQQKNLNPVTQILSMSTFWPAEAEHQHYYQKQEKQPYCHIWTKRF